MDQSVSVYMRSEYNNIGQSYSGILSDRAFHTRVVTGMYDSVYRVCRMNVNGPPTLLTLIMFEEQTSETMDVTLASYYKMTVWKRKGEGCAV
ncbi:hypothetical protein PoB_007260000 [Plakobranchus ocellatus]|uniref:Uncharacterized protein n=1 Tax=Plakobranchus ocellatus TaxID=259542 RepID=A0AAV4DPV7_9GAST|nr:hypothetical protein PoB_007260000 [Plakobranchus ocellatus]